MRAPEGSLMVGSVEQVVEKIVYEHQLFGFTRFFAQASLGFVPHEMTMKSIELFGTKVIPEVKRRLEIN
jgi:alkanesulfonate monooxygenase SsuD/methylene tetrahydromethanopterin reductase-like flavin-dependent oxidoreductase (luciferase family)